MKKIEVDDVNKILAELKNISSKLEKADSMEMKEVKKLYSDSLDFMFDLNTWSLKKLKKEIRNQSEHLKKVK